MTAVCVFAPFDKNIEKPSDYPEYGEVLARFGEKERGRIEGIKRAETALLSFGGLICLKRLTDGIAPENKKLTVLRDGLGKPFFEEAGIGSFNISHSGRLSAAVFTADSDRGVGIDIERIRAREGFDSISKRFFCEREREYISRSASPEKAFYTIWTAKESYSKYIGRGLSSIADTDVFSVSERREAYFSHYALKADEEDYIMTVCAPLRERTEIINGNGDVEIYEIQSGI
ncbi:MAG: 4'-phosphopantetheinyl transferase superfamily protein [Clostridia bacterium]|nr:4'-phosphopantetheinyl transferase superfamily protein [Clostridia bacterium]